MNQRRLIRSLQVSIGILLGLAAILLWMDWSEDRATDSGPPEDYFLPSPLPAPTFALTGTDGEIISSESFPQKLLVVFFGYSYCPDICPLTLSHLTQAFRVLEENGHRIQVLLITVDPQRDTPERLREYLTNFHPSFLGLTGTEEEIRKIADAFGVYFARVGEGESYTVDHTARSFVLDRGREIVLTFQSPPRPGRWPEIWRLFWSKNEDREE